MEAPNATIELAGRRVVVRRNINRRGLAAWLVNEPDGRFVASTDALELLDVRVDQDHLAIEGTVGESSMWTQWQPGGMDAGELRITCGGIPIDRADAARFCSGGVSFRDPA